MYRLIAIIFVAFTLLAFKSQDKKYSLKIRVDHLRNSKGIIQISLYNKDGSIPDEDFVRYYRQLKTEITGASASVTFTNLPKGRYAVNVLHDENENGEIDKGWVKPIEGIGFSNFSNIGLTNRPNFSKASFLLSEDKVEVIEVIYM